MSGQLLRNLTVSMFELASGYFFAAVSAIPLGLLMAQSKRLEYILDPIISTMYAMPRIALMPLIILIFGIGISSKIFLVYLGCFFPILISVFQGMRSVDNILVDMGRVFGAKGLSLVRHIYIPSILPNLIAGFRIALSIGLIMVVVGEFLVGNQGIGYQIAYEADFFNTSGVLAWVFIISFLSMNLTQLIRYFENRMRYWQ